MNPVEEALSPTKFRSLTCPPYDMDSLGSKEDGNVPRTLPAHSAAADDDLPGAPLPAASTAAALPAPLTSQSRIELSVEADKREWLSTYRT